MDYKITIADIIAVFSVLALATGVLYYAGHHKKTQEKYHSKEINLDLKFRLSILGALFAFLPVLVFMPIQYALLLLILVGLIISYGYHSEDVHVRKCTLKMVTLDESGGKRLDTRENLELFDTTDTAYYFKDLNGNEYIIPIGQIQEIVI